MRLRCADCFCLRRFPRREEVETSNKVKINGLGGVETQLFLAQDSGTLCRTEQGNKMLANFMAPAQLTLKIGAQVGYGPHVIEVVPQTFFAGDVD